MGKGGGPGRTAAVDPDDDGDVVALCAREEAVEVDVVPVDRLVHGAQRRLGTGRHGERREGGRQAGRFETAGEPESSARVCSGLLSPFLACTELSAGIETSRRKLANRRPGGARLSLTGASPPLLKHRITPYSAHIYDPALLPSELLPQLVAPNLVPVDLAPRLGQRAPQPTERRVRQLAVRLAQPPLERRLGRLERRDDGFRGRRRRERRGRLEGRSQLDVACSQRSEV